MLNSPIKVTILGTEYDLSRINQDNFSSKYLAKGENVEVTLDIKHQYERASALGQYERHNVDLKYVTFDPTGLTAPRTFQTYTILRTPRGTTSTNILSVLSGLQSVLTAEAAKVVAWES